MQPYIHRSSSMRISTLIVRVVFLTLMFTALPTRAQPGENLASSQPTPTPSEAPQGMLPVPDYSGDLWTRSRLTGDWGGARNDLTRKGIQFDVDFTQIVQSVVDGGKSTGTRYGGTLDYVGTF